MKSIGYKVKFKAWFIEKNELREIPINTIHMMKGKYFFLSPLPLSRYEEITLLPFTGILDKHGEEIYHRDIVKFHHQYKRLGVVEIHPHGVRINDGYEKWDVREEDILEVVGNMYTEVGEYKQLQFIKE